LERSQKKDALFDVPELASALDRMMGDSLHTLDPLSVYLVQQHALRLATRILPKLLKVRHAWLD
jgi:hypothetical protein